MSAEPDYTKYTEAELLEVLSRIDSLRSTSFPRLKAALEARGYLVNATVTGAASAKLAPETSRRHLQASVRLSPGHNAIAWLEPSRNDFHLRGTGTVRVDNARVQLSGRAMLFLFGLPYTRSVTMDRELITNVERIGLSVRFEYQRSVARHNVGRRQAVACEFGTSGIAEEFASLLPAERTPDFRPELAQEMAFEQSTRARAPHAPVLTTLIALNVAAFVVGLFRGAEWIATGSSVLVGLGSNFGPYTTDGEWWRLLTGIFLHIGILHLAFNMWALAATGPLIERLYGSWTYLFIYGVAGVASALASISWNPAVNSVGASGAVLGGYGALLAALVRGREAIPFGVVAPMRNSLLFYLLSVFVAGFVFPAVDNAAHVGGLAAGFFMALLLPAPLASERATGRGRLRLLMGAFAVLLIVGGVALASSRARSLAGDALFLHTRHWFTRGERIVIGRWQSITALVREGKLDDDAVGHAIESELLPFWEEAERRLHGVKLPESSPQRADLAFLTGFAASRRSAYRICLDAMRSHDHALGERCRAELARGDEIASQYRSRK